MLRKTPKVTEPADCDCGRVGHRFILLAAEQTLSNFSKSFSGIKGLEKNFSAKSFIKSIEYSKTEIVLTLYYQRQLGGFKDVQTDVGITYTANGRKFFSEMGKKKSSTFKGRGLHQDWLPDFYSDQTVTIILPNTIHACKRKNL